MSLSLLERLDGVLNPIMVKEVYQGFRGRGFVIGCGFALLICLGGYMTIVLSPTANQEALGQDLFAVLLTCMAIVALIVIPMGAGNQLCNEITSRTLDLIAITPLSPWTIVSGRFQAAVLKILLLFAYIGPFAIASFLLGGIGVGLILSLLGMLFIYALILSAAILALNALPALNPHYQLVARIGQVLLLLLFAFQGIFVQLLTIGYAGPFSAAPSGWDIVARAGVYSVLAALLAGFLLRLAADMLTPAGIRTFARSKLMLAVLLGVLIVPSLIEQLKPEWFPADFDSTRFLMGVLLWPLYFFAVFWSSQADQPRRRWHMILLGNGYTPTLLYVAGVTFGLGAAIALGVYDPSVIDPNTFAFPDLDPGLPARVDALRTINPGLVMFVHYLFFTGLARWLQRGLSPRKRSAPSYVTTVFSLWIVAYWLAAVFDFSLFGGSFWLMALIGAVAAWLGREKRVVEIVPARREG